MMIFSAKKKSNFTNHSSVAPHLPKEVRQGGRETVEKERWFLRLFILAVVFGFASGLVGGITVNSRFFDDWLWGEGGAWKIETRPGVGRSENKVLSRDNLSRKTAAILVDFYPAHAFSKEGFLDLTQKIGSGFFLTANGYIAASRNLFEKNSKKDLLAVNQKKNIFNIDKVILDPISELAIVKIAGEGMTSLPFIYEDDLGPDLDVFLPLSGAGVYQSKVLTTNFWSPRAKADWYFSSENIYRFGLLRDQFDKRLAGAPLIDSRGEVIGLLSGSTDPLTGFNSFLKANVISSALRKVLETGEIRRAHLGLHYKEADQIISPANQAGEFGVVLTNDPYRNVNYLEKKSPLAAAGLKNGDAIISLNGELISAFHSLPEILLDYNSGNKVQIKYRRGQEEKTVEAELGQLGK